MVPYHGSSTGGIKMLEPRLASLRRSLNENLPSCGSVTKASAHKTDGKKRRNNPPFVIAGNIRFCF